MLKYSHKTLQHIDQHGTALSCPLIEWNGEMPDECWQGQSQIIFMRAVTVEQSPCLKKICITQFSSVAQSCPTLCDPMDCSTPGLLVHRQLLEFTETRIHWVSDAIQPSHPLLSPSPPAFNLSQHQGLFKWVSSSHQVAKVLELQPQHQSFQWIFMISFRMDVHLCKYESCKYTPACWADLTQWSPHKCPVMLDLLVENQQTLETAN